MTVPIRRRPKAAEDAESIADYIARTSPNSAVRFLENLEATVTEMAKLPGTASRFESVHPQLVNLRFRRIKGFPNHVIFFIEHQDSIEIVRILHGARDLDTELKSP